MLRLALIPLLAAGLLNAADTPNIVVLYSDDAGYGDFGFQPDCVPEMRRLTPHIDTLAADGVRLSNAYMSGCVCAPSRAGLMTGRYQQRFGYENNLPKGAPTGVSLEETFGAKRLQALGYRTGLVGKWHLGYPDAYHPNERGFDWFYGLLQGSRSYTPIKNPTPHRVIQENGKALPEKGYVTDRFGDAACDFIRREKDGPFFLFVSFTAPHSPNQIRKSDAGRVDHIEEKKRRQHCGLTVALDDNIGKILACLEEEGLADSTLVVFTNDNGGATHTGADNTPLRGRKGGLQEGGIRVPMAMRWPGRIPAGSVIDDPVIALDLVPTFIEAAGSSVTPDMRLDGVSLVGRLTGEQRALPDRYLYWRRSGSSGVKAVRAGKWKLYHEVEAGAGPQLYDLSADIGESNDLSGTHPELVEDLAAKLAEWESGLIDPLFGPGSR